MDPKEIVTLVFPNYTKDLGVPVIQKWRISTLCMIPHFERMFNPESGVKWKETESREIIMEEDPEVFSEMISMLKMQKMERPSMNALAVMADYYGVTLSSPVKDLEIAKKPEEDVVYRVRILNFAGGVFKQSFVLPPHKRFVSFMVHDFYDDHCDANVKSGIIKMSDYPMIFSTTPSIVNSNMICNFINACHKEEKIMELILTYETDPDHYDMYYVYLSYIPL